MSSADYLLGGKGTPNATLIIPPCGKADLEMASLQLPSATAADDSDYQVLMPCLCNLQDCVYEEQFYQQ